MTTPGPVDVCSSQTSFASREISPTGIFTSLSRTVILVSLLYAGARPNRPSPQIPSQVLAGLLPYPFLCKQPLRTEEPLTVRSLTEFDSRQIITADTQYNFFLRDESSLKKKEPPNARTKILCYR